MPVFFKKIYAVVSISHKILWNWNYSIESWYWQLFSEKTKILMCIDFTGCMYYVPSRKSWGEKIIVKNAQFLNFYENNLKCGIE